MAQMTWKEFKAEMEAKGVKEDSKIDYIDISYPPSNAELEVSIDADKNYFSVSD